MENLRPSGRSQGRAARAAWRSKTLDTGQTGQIPRSLPKQKINVPLIEKVGRLAVVRAETYARAVGYGEPGNQRQEIPGVGRLPEEHYHPQAQFFAHLLDGG